MASVLKIDSKTEVLLTDAFVYIQKCSLAICVLHSIDTSRVAPNFDKINRAEKFSK